MISNIKCKDDMSSNTDKNNIKYGTSVDELAERLISSGVEKKDTALFLAHNWKKFAGLAGVFLLVFLLSNQYKSTQLKRSYDASQKLESISNSFQQLLINDFAKDTTGTDSQKDINIILENIKAIETSNSDLDYSRLANIYKLALEIKRGEFEQARAELVKFNTSNLFNNTNVKSTKEVSKNNIFDELAALQSLRLEIKEGKSDIGTILERIRSLIYSSRFVDIEAILLLARISENTEQKQFTKETIDNFVSIRPENREILANSLSQEGFSYLE